MTRLNRGAARVSVVWMITVLVLFFASLGFAFVATSDLNAQQKAREAAIAEKETAIARFDNEASTARATAQNVGWFDAASADPRTNVEAMAASVETFKDAFGITEASAKTLESVLAPAMNAYKSVNDELILRRNRITTLEGELSQARKTVADVTKAKDDELNTLRQQLTDLGEKYQRNEQDASRRLAASQAQVNELDAAKRDIEREKDDAMKAAEKERKGLVGRIRSMSHDLSFLKEPDRPDGEVTAVSGTLPLAWINLGANHRLARGTTFDIVSATPGRERFKGQCRVTELRPTSAKVELVGIVDAYDPIVAGDLIINPLYTSQGVRQAVLAGRFSSPSEAQLIALLDRIGIEVQPELDVDTDYLIVGSAVFTDEDGETLDEPKQPKELDVYREAEAKGINIVTVDQLRGYFVF
jgi:hypothetical protein